MRFCPPLLLSAWLGLALAGSARAECVPADQQGIVWARQLVAAPAQITGAGADTEGHLIVVGNLGGAASVTLGAVTLTNNAAEDGFVLKLRTDRTIEWVRRLNVPATFIGVDATGAVHLMGPWNGGDWRVDGVAQPATGPEALKTGIGSTVLVKLRGDAGAADVRLVSDRGFQARLGPSGEIIAFGNLSGTNTIQLGTTVLSGSNTFWDGWVGKFNAQRDLAWTFRATGEWDEAINDVAVDVGGNLAVTGSFESRPANLGGSQFYPATYRRDPDTGKLSGIADLFVLKLNVNGGVLWAQKAGGGWSDAGKAVAFAPSGDVWVSGTYGINDQWPVNFGSFVVTNADRTISNTPYIASLNAGGSFTRLRSWVGVSGAGRLLADPCGGFYTVEQGGGYLRRWPGDFTGNALVTFTFANGSMSTAVAAKGQVWAAGPFPDPAGLLTYAQASAPGGVGERFDFTVPGGGSLVFLLGNRTNPAAPFLVEFPRRIERVAGNTLTLEPAYGGTPPLTFQWSQGGVRVPNATNAILSITNIQLAGAGSYSLSASNRLGVANQLFAEVVVHVPPGISGLPVFLTLPAGTNITLDPVVSGTAPLSYQWRRNGIDLPGKTNRVLAWNPVEVADAGEYSLRAQNPGGAVTSGPVLLKVDASVPLGLLDQWKDAMVFRAGQEKSLRGLTYDGSAFLAAGDTGTFLFSSDGANWTLSNTGLGVTHYGVLGIEGARLVLGNPSGGYNVAVQTDGISWVGRNPAPSVNGYYQNTTAATYANGLFVVVGSRYIYTSANTINWFLRGMEFAQTPTWQGVAYGLGRFVAVGTGTPTRTHSIDGITWQSASGPYAEAVCFAQDKFVAVGGATVSVSTNGVDWLTVSTPPGTRTLHGVAFGEGVFVAVGNEATVLSSEDGYNWVKRDGGPAANLWDVAYGGGRFVAVGDLGTIRRTAIVIRPPAIALATNLSITAGAPLRLDATVTGGGTLTYRWSRDGVALADDARITGSATPALSFQTTLPTDSGPYTLLVQNNVGATVSATVEVRVLVPTHTADWREPKWKIDATEMNAVLALWRAGAYHVEAVAPGGYGAGAGDQNGARHQADFRELYWKIDATEMNRVLSYWRAGAYHPDATTPDAFAPGPTPGGP